MALIVQKYGGTSMGTPERILNVARRVKRWHDHGHKVVVVVSAMSGETYRLLALAKAITETPRTSDLFWKKYMNLELNQRQKNLINLFLNAEIVEVSNSDYVRLFQTTRETAKRDLKKLRDLELLSSDSTLGRSVRYRFRDA